MRNAEHSIKKGDLVMVIAGGNSQSRANKGKVGKVIRFVSGHQRVVIEGLNFVTRHQRPTGPNKPSGKIPREAGIHVSNLMYYVEKLKRPVRIKHKLLDDGRKVRGYVDPSTKEFITVDK